MAGHQALLQLFDRRDTLMAALEDQAKAARKASRLTHAQSALLQLQLTLQKLLIQVCPACNFKFPSPSWILSWSIRRGNSMLMQAFYRYLPIVHVLAHNTPASASPKIEDACFACG